MRNLLFILLFSTFGYSQNLIQTFTDRCTGEVKTVSVSMTGVTTVVFYNKVGQFTAADVQSGALKAWMEETYVWWTNISPCSTNTATNQSAQQTSQNAASNASNAAANASSGATNTTNTNATSNGTGSTSNTSTSSDTSTNSSSSGSSSGSTDSNSSSGDGSSQSNDSSGGETSSGGDGETTETSSEGEGGSSENSESQESTEEESSSESESTEDSESEESESEEVEEESSEEESEEESKEEEEKEEKKEEKKKRNPIAVAANVMTQSGLDGTLTQAASFGFSQSSLTGATTYSANVMVWDNLKQFSLNLSKSDVWFNYDREEKYFLYNPETKKEDLYFGSTYGKGSIDYIQSLSASFMYIYGTKVISFGLSNVYLGQKENFWKGFVGGFALSGTVINIEDSIMIMPSGVLFGTKPFPTKRVTISPMIALALNPVSYTFSTKEPAFKGELALNEHITYIVGSNFDVALTQRFRFNIGGNIIGTTLPGIPITWSATIGSKFQF